MAFTYPPYFRSVSEEKDRQLKAVSPLFVSWSLACHEAS